MSRSARQPSAPQPQQPGLVWLPVSRSGEPSRTAYNHNAQLQQQQQQRQLSQHERIYYANEELVRQQRHLVSRRPPAPPPPASQYVQAEAQAQTAQLAGLTLLSGSGSAAESSRDAALQQLMQASVYSANSHFLRAHEAAQLYELQQQQQQQKLIVVAAQPPKQMVEVAPEQQQHMSGGSNMSLDRRARSVKAVKQMQLLNRMVSRADDNDNEEAYAGHMPVPVQRVPVLLATAQQQPSAESAATHSYQYECPLDVPVVSQHQLNVRTANDVPVAVAVVVPTSGRRASQPRIVPVPLPNVPPQYAPPNGTATSAAVVDGGRKALAAAGAHMSRANPELRESMLNVQLSPPSMIPQQSGRSASVQRTSAKAARPTTTSGGAKKAPIADRYAAGPVHEIDSVYGTWRRGTPTSTNAAVKQQQPPPSAANTHYISSASLLDMQRASAAESGRPQSSTRKKSGAPSAEQQQSSANGGISRFLQSASDLLRRSARSLSRNRSRSRSKSPATYNASNGLPPNPNPNPNPNQNPYRDAHTMSNGQTYAPKPNANATTTVTGTTTGDSRYEQNAGRVAVAVVAVKSSGRAARARPNAPFASSETTVALNGTLQRSKANTATAASSGGNEGGGGDQSFRRQKSISERIGGFFRSMGSRSRSRSRGRSRSPNSQPADGDEDEDEVSREQNAQASGITPAPASASASAVQHRSRHTEFTNSPAGERGRSRDGRDMQQRHTLQPAAQHPHPYYSNHNVQQLQASASALASVQAQAEHTVQLVRSSNPKAAMAPSRAPPVDPSLRQPASASASASGPEAVTATATSSANSFDVGSDASQVETEAEPNPAVGASASRGAQAARPRTTLPAPLQSYEPSVNIKLAPFPMVRTQTNASHTDARALGNGGGTNAFSSSSSRQSAPNGVGVGAEKAVAQSHRLGARQGIARPTPLHPAPTPPEVPRLSPRRTAAAGITLQLIGQASARREHTEGAANDSASR